MAAEPDFRDLTALYVNCTLKRSPEVSNTQGLMDASIRLMREHGVTVDTIRRDDVQLAEVTVKAPAPVIGLLGSAGTITVRGHAILEEQ